MRLTYGIEVKESNDVYIGAAEEAAATMIAAGIPGSFVVDFIPICKLASQEPGYPHIT